MRTRNTPLTKRSTAPYRRHYGEVHAFEGGELALLRELNEFDVTIGILTNREREFFEHELAKLDDGAWCDLFAVTICGDDSTRRKPNPEPIYKALEVLKEPADLACWYPRRQFYRCHRSETRGYHIGAVQRGRLGP